LADAVAGFRSSSRSRDAGDVDGFTRVAEALVTWDVHRIAGFRVITAPERAEVGALFIARAPFVPVITRCEVTELIDEPERRGFRYRTLPGHPLEGEELFLVETRDGRTVFAVSERSRPASWITRMPGARWTQGRINERYLDAVAAVASRP